MQRPARTLIVEDERIIALDLRTRLTRMGHPVVDCNLGPGGDGPGRGPATRFGANGHPRLHKHTLRIAGYFL